MTELGDQDALFQDGPGEDGPGADARAAAGKALADSMDVLPIGVLVFIDGGLVRANRVWTSLTGLSVRQSSGDQWLTAVNVEDRPTASALATAGPLDHHNGRDWRLSAALDGEDVWVHADVRYVDLDDQHACVMTLTEIDAHKANELRLLHLATHDSLTGLANRSAFMAKVADAITTSAVDTLTAVLFIDLDRFKEINDTFGHGCGDRLLVAVAERITTAVRPTDCVARLGGDEIGVLCTSLHSHREAKGLAARLVKLLGATFAIDDRLLSVGASVGVAYALGGPVESQHTAEMLVDEADRAMYRAKFSGGARWSGLDDEHVADVHTGRALPAANPDLIDGVEVLERDVEREAERLLAAAGAAPEELIAKLDSIRNALAETKMWLATLPQIAPGGADRN